MSAAPVSARQLYIEALTFAEQDQLDRAYPLLQRAWKLDQVWQTAQLLGRVEADLKKFRDAAEHLTFFLREARQSQLVPDEERAIDEQRLTEAKTHVGTLNIVVDPVGADVFVDGIRAGRAPLIDPVFVEPGSRRVEVRRAGYEATAETREVAAGGAALMTLRMTPVPQWRGSDTGVVVAGAGAALALASVGVMFAVKANASATETHRCNSQDGDCDTTNTLTRSGRVTDLHGQWQQQRNAWVGSFVAAGAIAAGTIVYAAVAANRKPPAPIAAVVGPGAAAVTLSLEW